MYSFRTIRAAILSSERPNGFPYSGPLTSERLAAWRTAPHLQQLLREAREDAGRAAATAITTLPFSSFKLFEQTGSRREFELPYFERRARLLALVINAMVDENDEHLSALEDLIWAICDEYTWCLPAHLWRSAPTPQGGRLVPEQMVDLFAAETAHALAETITLLGERLHPWIAERVRAEIEQRTFRPLFHDPVHFHWESVPMNWASVCAGACGMAALLLVDDRERLAGMIERCCRTMECFLEGFGPDGGCAEGIGYWQYGFGYYVYFSEMLRDYTGGELDLLQGELIERVAAFPAGVNLGGDAFVNYSDGQATMRLHVGLLSRLQERLGIPLPELNHTPHLHADRAYRWPHVTRDLVWTDPQIFGQQVADGSRLYDHLGWVIDRRRAGNVPVAFSARGGHNGEPHNQNDLGHFVVHIGGTSLLADLGAGLYTKDYFGPRRYKFIHNSSAGHSVPIIDGQTQSPGTDFRAEVLRYEPHADGVVFELDLTRAYAVESLQNYIRSFEWQFDPASASAQLVITDRFTFAQMPDTLEEVFISLHQPEVAEGRATWRGQRGSVELTYDASQYIATVEQIESQNHYAERIVVHRLLLAVRQPTALMTCRFVLTCRVAIENRRS